METRICKTCNEEKELSFFRKKIIKDKIYYEWTCKDCQKVNQAIRSKKHYEDNKEESLLRQTNYYKNNKELCNNNSKLWAQNNPEKSKEIKYKSFNKRIKKDISFRLRKNISELIRVYLKTNDSSKNGKSILKYLPYNMQDLKIHLENLFEPWMTWNNRGKYNSNTWDDNDQSTWTWQIDHIMPHSIFKYTSMEDEEFKECWKLSNLRPLSSKDNWFDGINRIRHKKAA